MSSSSLPHLHLMSSSTSTTPTPHHPIHNTRSHTPTRYGHRSRHKPRFMNPHSYTMYAAPPSRRISPTITATSTTPSSPIPDIPRSSSIPIRTSSTHSSRTSSPHMSASPSTSPHTSLLATYSFVRTPSHIPRHTSRTSTSTPRRERSSTHSRPIRAHSYHESTHHSLPRPLLHSHSQSSTHSSHHSPLSRSPGTLFSLTLGGNDSSQSHVYDDTRTPTRTRAGSNTLYTHQTQDEREQLIIKPVYQEEEVTSISSSQPMWAPAAIVRGRRWLAHLNPESLSKRFAPNMYAKLLSQHTCFLYDKHIRKDLPRTFPHHPVLMTIHGRAMLYNVLKAYSIYDADIGYSQGMAFLVGFLMLHIPDEETVFWCLVVLMYNERYEMRRLYSDNCESLKYALHTLDDIVMEHHPELAQHLQNEGVDSSVYATQWLLTVFSYRFPIDFAAAVWDHWIEHGQVAIFQTAVAVLSHMSPSLLPLPFESLIPALTHPDNLARLPFDVAEHARHITLSKVHITRITTGHIPTPSSSLSSNNGKNRANIRNGSRATNGKPFNTHDNGNASSRVDSSSSEPPVHLLSTNHNNSNEHSAQHNTDGKSSPSPTANGNGHAHDSTFKPTNQPQLPPSHNAPRDLTRATTTSTSTNTSTSSSKPPSKTAAHQSQSRDNPDETSLRRSRTVPVYAPMHSNPNSSLKSDVLSTLIAWMR